MKLNAFKQLGMLPLLLAIAFLMPLSAAHADCPTQEFTRKINREFNTTPDGMTAIYNRYGKVNIKTWAENKVKIEITIVVNAGSQKDADRTFDRIKFNFANTSGYVKAETVIEEQSKTWGWKNDDDFKINYEVWMPIGNQLDLKNKYGNSYIADMDGKLMAEIKYGDLKAENIKNDADLSLGYGKAGINQVRNLYGQVGYGELYVITCNDMQMDTKYSDVKFDRVNTMRITSKYDDFNIGDVDDMRLQTKYSDVKVSKARALFITASYTDVRLEHADDIVDANLSYGDLHVKNLGKSFQTVNIVGKYTDVVLDTEPGTDFRLDAEGSYMGMKYPQSVVVKYMVKDGSRKQLRGFHGNAEARGIVKVRMSYGDWVLR